MSRRLAGAAAAAAVAALALVVWLLLTSGDETARPAGPTTSGPSAAASTMPTSPPRVAASPLPDEVPGFIVSAVTLRTYRLSLVFRLRNTILNGLPGKPSDYAFEAAQARRGAGRALLFGIAAVPGAAPPDIPRNVNALVGVTPVSRHRTGGRAIDVYRLPDYSLAVVDAGRRRALVAIAPGRRLAEDLADAAARAVSRE